MFVSSGFTNLRSLFVFSCMLSCKRTQVTNDCAISQHLTVHHRLVVAKLCGQVFNVCVFTSGTILSGDDLITTGEQSSAHVQ